MERFKQFMVVAMSILRLFPKLENLLTENVSNSNVPVREAMAELKFIFISIRDAEEGRIILDLDVSFWKELQSALRKLEDSIDTFNVEAELPKWNICNKITSLICNRPLRDLSAISDDMEKLNNYAETLRQQAKTGPTAATSSHPCPTQPRDLAYFALDESDFVLYDKKKELTDQLCIRKRGEFDTVIAVTGLTGSGKTVLVKRVFNLNIIRCRFYFRAWVNCKQDFVAKDILVHILKQLSQESLDENLQVNELKSRLKIFSEENHCLIVIDDVQTSNDLNKLSDVLGCIGFWSMFILITCNEVVACAASQFRKPIRLQSLNKEESWELLLKKTQIAEDSFNSQESIYLQNHILRKCNGSPLAVLVLGGILSTRDLSNWRSVIEQLSSMDSRQVSVPHEVQQGLPTIDEELSTVIHPAAQEKIFLLSFQDLPFREKCCFLYFGHYRRAAEIPIRRLFHHWRVDRWLTALPEEHIDGIDPAWEILKQLISSNLIEVEKARVGGRPQICRMPGSIWDVFHPKAESLHNLYVHNTVDTSAESPTVDIWRLVDNAGFRSCPSSDPYIRSLHSLVSFYTRKRDLPNQYIGRFLNNVVNRGFGMLTLLDLEGVYKPVLHETLGKLSFLKYLGLRGTFLDSLPNSVGDLLNLEVLDVKHTCIGDLPRTIGKLEKLKYLYLNNYDMSIRKSNIGSLTNLESLSGLSIGKKNHGNNFLSKFHSLKKLKLTCSSDLAVMAVANGILQLRKLQCLHLRSVNGSSEPSILKLGDIAKLSNLRKLSLLGQLPRDYSFPSQLEALTLSISDLEQDPMPKLGQLPHLKSLRLLGKSYAGQQMTCLLEGFSELQFLTLWRLENLEEWIVEEGAMPLLRELDIRGGNRLQQPEGLQLITTLKEVKLTDMSEEFVEIFKTVVVNASVQEQVFPV